MRHSELIEKLEGAAFNAPMVSEERVLENYVIIDELILGEYCWIRGFLDRHISVFMRDMVYGMKKRNLNMPETER